MELEKENNFFDALGVEVRQGNVEIGKTYPIFGAITKFLQDTPGDVLVEVNHNILARMKIFEQDKIETLKVRAFETGIFVATITQVEPTVEVNCQTVIFGRPQSFHA